MLLKSPKGLKRKNSYVACFPPGSEYSLHQIWFESVKELKS
jgi:hypothetical protein